MELKKADYKIIEELSNSTAWKLICQYLDERIESIKIVLETPTNDDMFWSVSEMEAVKQLALLNYKKCELTYLRKLKQIPKELLNTEVKVQKFDK